VGRVNQRLSTTERIRRQSLVAPFAVENGFLTPTQKVRRRLVIAAYAERLKPQPLSVRT
jgi:long-subunit acyl-CoA synthetase (AMP-forming)